MSQADKLSRRLAAAGWCHFLSIQGSQPLVEGRRLYFLPLPFHDTCDLGGPLEPPLERPLDPFDEDLLRSADPPFEGFQEV